MVSAVTPGGVDGGGVAETGRGSDVVGGQSDRVVAAGVPDSQLGVKARPVGRPRSGAALTPIPTGASFGWRGRPFGVANASYSFGELNPRPTHYKRVHWTTVAGGLVSSNAGLVSPVPGW